MKDKKFMPAHILKSNLLKSLLLPDIPKKCTFYHSGFEELIQHCKI